MEPAQIDSKDSPGEYRDQVRADVLRRAGGPGRAVTDPAELVGDWQVAFVGDAGEPPAPAFVYRLRADGTASFEMAGHPPDAGDWRLNPGGSLSLLTWCPPMPELGIDEPQRDEDRRLLAALAGGRLVAWNGDGSSALLLSPLGR